MNGGLLGFFNRRHEDKIWRRSTERSNIYYVLPESPHEYLDPLSRQEVARRYEWLLEKFGMVKEGTNGVARHTIGTGLTLQLNSDDPEFNVDGRAAFNMYALTPSRVDISGRRNLYQMQRTAVQQLIGRGEFFSANRENPRWKGTFTSTGAEVGEPCVQLFDANQIESPEDADESVYDGVKLGQYFEPLGYYARQKGGTHDFIPANLMTHWFEPTGVDQVRGQSAWSPVVDKLVDWHDLAKLVVATAKTQNAIAIAVKKLAKIGGRGIGNRIKQRIAQTTGQSTEPETDTSALEKAFPGLVAYLGADGEAEMIHHTSPNDKLEPFLSNLIGPDVFLAIGVPSEFFWRSAKGSAADNRFTLIRADLRFKVLADELCERWLNGIAFRFLSHRIETGMLKAPTDPNWAQKIGWQKPPRLTVDNGRDGALELQQLENGADNLRNIYDRRGQDYREEGIVQWTAEWAEFLLEAKRKKLPEWVIQKWRAGTPGAGGNTAQQDGKNGGKSNGDSSQTTDDGTAD
jgi:capsid protein